MTIRVFSTSGAARELQIAESSVRRLARAGQLSSMRDQSGRLIFSDVDLVRYRTQAAERQRDRTDGR